jgi:hypothetical protein
VAYPPRLVPAGTQASYKGVMLRSAFDNDNDCYDVERNEHADANDRDSKTESDDKSDDEKDDDEMPDSAELSDSDGELEPDDMSDSEASTMKRVWFADDVSVDSDNHTMKSIASES